MINRRTLKRMEKTDPSGNFGVACAMRLVWFFVSALWFTVGVLLGLYLWIRHPRLCYRWVNDKDEESPVRMNRAKPYIKEEPPSR